MTTTTLNSVLTQPVGSTANIDDFSTPDRTGEGYSFNAGFSAIDLTDPENAFLRAIGLLVRPQALTDAIENAGINSDDIFFEVIGFDSEDGLDNWIEERSTTVPQGYWVAAFDHNGQNPDGVPTREIVFTRVA